MKYRILLFVSLLGLLSSCGGDDDTQMEESQVISTTITEITNITDFEAQINVSMENGTSNTITERGVVYGLENNPTVDDTKIIDSGNQNNFSVNITGLTSATQYFVRSYFIVGGDVSYSGGNNFVTTDLCGQNVFEGLAYLKTQAEVEAFGAMGYCKINGNLLLGTIIEDDDKITDISSLSSIREVHRLRVNNTLLFNLDQLENLTETDVVSINYNDNLLNVDGLENLNTSVSNVQISNNPALENINGLSNLYFDGDFFEYISISRNESLLNIDGLSGFKDLSSFNIGGITISENPLITNIDGLSNLINVNDCSISIFNNDALLSIDALSNITNSQVIDVNISDNPVLTNINGVSGMTSILSLNLRNLPLLTSLTPLSNTTIISNVNISSNDGLVSLEGLSNLENLQSIIINENNNILNLNGLNSLSSNLSLFRVKSNASLSNFCSLVIPFQNINIEQYNVSDNAYNPTQQDIIDGDCSI
ncbi:MAG: hypothetical protein ACSHW7_07055 [Patiriisocius sp.]|uniref:hypothetical protein n=1 Tax=Patiriisocius sp. TaxID=2822396 RepID=UPI003EF1F033